MRHRCPSVAAALALCAVCAAGSAADYPQPRVAYPVIDTGQDRCFTNTREVAYPNPGQAFDGQDAQYAGRALSYKDNGDGTVTDLNTGLMWVKNPGRSKKTFAQAVAGARACRVGGHNDWRLPSIKERYSLIDFKGYTSRTAAQSRPYIDTKFFAFRHGDESQGERLIDAQYWSANEYAGTTMNGAATVFGVNFADDRIKGYPKLRGPRGTLNRQFVRYVRGNPAYGRNDFADNRDGTVTDRAAGLTWTKADSGKAMNWENALNYAEDLRVAGHDDWRLPNAKELQSIVDYSRAPDAADAARRGPAIDPVFPVTKVESWCWTSTTHLENRTCGFAVYICFGRAFGTMYGRKMDVHGAGAQRSDPKTGEPDAWKGGNIPQRAEDRLALLFALASNRLRRGAIGTWILR